MTRTSIHSSAVSDAIPSLADSQEFRGRDPQRQKIRYADWPQYPMLYPIVPMTREGLIRHRRELRGRPVVDGCILDLSDHFMAEIRLHHNFAAALAATRPAERPRFFAEHLRSAYPNFEGLDAEETYQKLTGYVPLAWQMVRDFVAIYVPEHLRAPMTGDGRSETIWDPVELMLECAKIPVMDGGPLDRMRAFEMRRTLVLAQELMGLDTGLAERARINRISAALTRLLEDRFFVPDLNRDIVVRAAIDYEVGATIAILGPDETPPAGAKVRPFPMNERFFKFRDRVYPVFYNPDQKLLFAVLEKMLARSIWEANVLPDLNRFRMVCRTRGEVGICIERVQEEIFKVGGTSHRYESNFRALRAADESNSASSPKYLLIKAEHKLRGDKIEGQYLPLSSYLNASIASSEVGHRSYKRRQFADLYELFFPSVIYPVNWSDPETRGLLVDY